MYRGRFLSASPLLRKLMCSLKLRAMPVIPSLRVPWTTEHADTSPTFRPTSFDVYDTQVSERSGLKIASERASGGFSTLGVAIDAGPRHETGYLQGISHFLTKLAFGPTEKYPSRQAVLSALEESGAIFDCQASHDVILYAVSCRTDCVDRMLDLLSDCIFRPIVNDAQISIARESVRGELDDLDMRPDPAPILNEMLHKAAFDGTLAISQYCDRSNLDRISSHDIHSYINRWYRKERMAVCCVGDIGHEDFVSRVYQNFLAKQDNDMFNTGEDSQAKWRGGCVMVEKDLSDVSLGPTPMPELLHLSIGLRAPSFVDPEYVVACVLQSLMGGGGSFSAGGPGKGMYSRLYLRALNHYGWMHNAVCTNTPYKDIGLFFMHTSCDPPFGKQMSEIAVRELLAVSEKIGEEELRRAKNQLKSSILMNLEQRPVAFEDIARQVVGMGSRRNPVEFCQMIDNVSDKDVKRLVVEMLSYPPAVAGYGSVSLLPDHHFFCSKLNTTGVLRRLFK